MQTCLQQAITAQKNQPGAQTTATSTTHYPRILMAEEALQGTATWSVTCHLAAYEII